MRRTISAFAAAAALAVTIAAGLASAAGAAPTRFSTAVEDLPLMAGLEETAAAPFETAQGRIVRVEAAGAVAADAVAAYYAETLPQLGWRQEPDAAPAERDGRLIFTRAGERLSVRVETTPAGARVSFLITPAVSAAVR